MFRAVPIFVTAAALVLLGRVADAQPPTDYPRLRAALQELREARKELDEARDTWPPGHKEQAMAAINSAIESLKIILAVRGEDFRGVHRNPDYYNRYPDHRRLRAALDDLRDARQELAGARANFGNQKERALRDIDTAMRHIAKLVVR
jgi:hypothetical protein